MKPGKETGPLRLWPDGYVTGSGPDMQEETRNWSPDPATLDRVVTNIRHPAIHPVLPTGHGNGMGMIIIPGGGYECIAIDKEGFDIARHFAGLGITCFVLSYRLPGKDQSPRASLSDTIRAIRLVRYRAGDWDLNPDRIGVAGFSAGGHLAASLSTRFAEHCYAPLDTVDIDEAGTVRPARPDFSLLCYPVISMRSGITHDGSRELFLGKAPSTEAVWKASCDEQVAPATPPAFIVHAGDDGAVPVENSLRYYAALRTAGVGSCELHIFPEGGHGFALREKDRPAGVWPDLAARWLCRF